MGRAFEYRKASKLKRWGNMSRVFPKLAKAITIAAKQGGGDPHSNSALRTAILNAKAQNLPKTNIESAIKRATAKDSSNFTEVNFEGKGPFGALIFVECATDNNTRTVANIKMHFSKNKGQIVPTGSLEFLFSRKAIFEFIKPKDMDLDELELELIDAGLEELECEENEEGEDTKNKKDTEAKQKVFAYGDYKDFGTLHTKFEELKIELTKACLQRIPNNPQKFSKSQEDEIDILLAKLDDDDDVQAIYTNIS